MTPAQARHLFEYRDGALFWKNSSNPKKTPAGSPAGTRHERGYIHIQYMRRIYKAHKLIFLMHHEYTPTVVDHADGDTSNNSIENLRATSFAGNARNAKRRTDNSSGVKNVCWHKRIKKWGVTVTIDRKIKHFGYYDDLDFAALVAHEARAKYHGSFARHA